MSRHLVLLPAPEAEWARLPASEHEKGMRSHEQFHRDLREGGHRLVTGAPLTPSTTAVSMRPDGSGGALVTDGPFTESAEQIVGFYLVETDDRDALLRLCAQLSSRGELIEFRDVVGPGDDDGGDDAGAGAGEAS
jgi:hypothetical protein